MRLEKVSGFSRIYQAECFPNDVDAMFGKNKGERKRYMMWLYTLLTILDQQGLQAVVLQQFEYLQNTEDPRLYSLRHPHSQINERYIYTYIDEEVVVLLTAFKEKDANYYKTAIERAKRIFLELEENDNGDS